MARTRRGPRRSKTCVFCAYWTGDADLEFVNSSVGYEYEALAVGRCIGYGRTYLRVPYIQIETEAIRDFTDKQMISSYQQIQNYFAGSSNERRESAHLFIKDTANSYPLQNEWRLVAFDFDIDNHYCAKGCDGINLKTGFSTRMSVLETEQLITLRCSENFLFD